MLYSNKIVKTNKQTAKIIKAIPTVVTKKNNNTIEKQ